MSHIRPTLLLGLSLASAMALGLAACGTSSNSSADAGGDAHSPTDPLPSCLAIVEQCHPVDQGSGPTHECHELAHDATEDAVCATRKAECLATCSSASHDSGMEAAPETSDASGHAHVP